MASLENSPENWWRFSAAKSSFTQQQWGCNADKNFKKTNNNRFYNLFIVSQSK